MAAILVQAAKELPETQKLAISVKYELFSWFLQLQVMPEEMMRDWFSSVYIHGCKEYFRIVDASITSYGDFLHSQGLITT